MTAEIDHSTNEPSAAEAPAGPPPPPAGTNPPAPARAPGRITTRHVLTVILALLPGLGHVYNGLYQRGIKFFLVALAAIYLATEVGLAGMAVAFVWLFNVIDAYRQADLLEQGRGPDSGVQDEARTTPDSQFGFLWGAAFFVVGFLFLLDHTFGYDMEDVMDFWPVGLLAIGAWLMINAWSQWRRRREEDGNDPAAEATAAAD